MKQNIRYTQRVPEYVEASRFSTAVTKNTVDHKIEFEIDDLRPDVALFWASLPKRGISSVTIQDFEIDKSGFPIGRPKVKATDYIAEGELSLPQAIQKLMEFAEKRQRLEVELAPLVEAYEAEQKRLSDEAEAKREQQRLEAERKHEAKVKEAKTLVYENGSCITNLSQRVALVSGLEFDGRFKSWIKRVDSVDRDATNGYAFKGVLVKDGTIEIKEGDDAMFLVASVTGSRKYTTTQYRVVKLVGGMLELTNIETSDSEPGWALRIRGRVAQLVDEVKGTGETDPFTALRELVKTDADTVTVSRELLAKLLERV